MYPLQNCNDSVVPNDYDILDDTYTCWECNEGTYFDWLMYECIPCNEWVDNCNSCYQNENFEDVICEECDGGLMPEYTGDICIPRFSHCADADLDEQPNGLSVNDDDMLYCGLCEDGFYWDEDLFICDKCTVEGCELCSEFEKCDTCEPGLLVQLDGMSCFSPIENCKVPVSIQPQGLVQNHELHRFECGACKTGYTFISESATCEHCSQVLEGCLVCSDSETCVQCRSNYELVDGECVDMISIKNCEEVDPERMNICIQCEEGFGISYDQRKCSDCQDIDVTCTSCVSGFGIADICEECEWPATLQNGTCVWEGCNEWSYNTLGVLECLSCSVGYSFFDGFCVACRGD